MPPKGPADAVATAPRGPVSSSSGAGKALMMLSSAGDQEALRKFMAKPIVKVGLR